MNATRPDQKPATSEMGSARATRLSLARHKPRHSNLSPLKFSLTHVFPVIISLVCLLIFKSSRHESDSRYNSADAFHLSFAHRLVKSVHSPEQLQQHQYTNSINPLLNPPENLIRPIECRNANNHSEAGICMFSIDCMQNKGVPLSICKHNYFVGTCCKLPDYNNFVGIVYDLRETELSGPGQQQALEARRGSSDALHIFKSASASNNDASPSPSAAIGSSPSLDSTAAGSSANQAAQDVTHHSIQPSPDSSTTTTRLADISTSQSEPKSSVGVSSTTPGQQQPTGTTSMPLLDETSGKYLISSTKLFGFASSAAAPNTAPTARPNVELVHELAAAKPAGETARNAEGSLQQQPASQISFESIGGEQVSHQTNSTMNSAYELLASAGSRLGSNVAQDQSDQQLASNQQTVVVSSAHSAAGSVAQPQQQQSTNKNSVYLLGDETTTAELASSAPNIVYSNNHQATSSAPLATLASSASTSSHLSDQEFALSTGSQSASETSSQQPPMATESVKIEPSSPAATSVSASNSSPFVDLISSSLAASTESPSPGYQHETTTPFTSSLSTAILPSISSHPYAPTTTTTSSPIVQTTLASSAHETTLVSNTTTNITGASQATSSSSTVQPAQSDNTSGASSTPSAATSGGSSSPFVAQYYSTAAVPLEPGATHQHHGQQQHHAHYQHHKPLAGSPAANLQVASKIVTGNSAANNLIPGLSGLQSAILAHIPFKIASGLSSGLSSYLQAAMKPASQLPTRPLISSNTAPALQYQQHGQHNQTSGAKPPTGSGSNQMSAVRFPAPSSSSTSASSAESSSSSSASGVAQHQQQRDVVKEAQLVCGLPRVSELKASKRVARIVGGNQSAFGQWPWMVSLRQWRKGAFLHKCGAALLNENWAITAAHCVENVKAPDLLLRLGEFDVSNQNEPFPYIERRVKTVVSHPSFDPKTFEYDLALIRFTEPIQYERNIIPVCVPQGNDSYVDRMATVIGWGRLFEDGPLPDVIQHVDVPIITNQECEKMYKSAGFVEEIPEMFICAGISKGGRDSCEGDSGGPLTMVDHDGRSYLVGIISWGIGCALPSQPGVYTRITAFSSWINQIMAN